jgi:hypothetical protein
MPPRRSITLIIGTPAGYSQRCSGPPVKIDSIRSVKPAPARPARPTRILKRTAAPLDLRHGSGPRSADSLRPQAAPPLHQSQPPLCVQRGPFRASGLRLCSQVHGAFTAARLGRKRFGADARVRRQALTASTATASYLHERHGPPVLIAGGRSSPRAGVRQKPARGVPFRSISGRFCIAFSRFRYSQGWVKVFKSPAGGLRTNGRPWVPHPSQA